MKLNELDQWLDELENDCCQDSADGNMAEPSYNDLESELKERVMSEIQELIHYSSNTGDDIFSGSINEIDVESVLENFNPEPSQKSASDKKKRKKYSTRQFLNKHDKSKVAVIILICIAGLSISGVTYASISGRLSGVYKAEPELVAQLDHPNPIQEAVDTIPIIPPKDPNRFDGSEIISASSFENDQFFNSATDIELDNLGEGVYATDDFIYDQKDIAVFTRENGDSWYLNAGESLQITIAIDTSFAASEARGEQMTLAYIKDGMFFELSLERIVDTPNTYTFVAPEDGDYYLAIINESFSYLKVTTLEIRQ